MAWISAHFASSESHFFIWEDKKSSQTQNRYKIATTLIHRKKQLHNQRVYANVSEIVNLLKNAKEYEELQLQLQRDRSSQKVRNLIETKPIVVDKFNVNKQQHNGAIKNSEKHLEAVRDFEPDAITEGEFLEDETDQLKTKNSTKTLQPI